MYVHEPPMHPVLVEDGRHREHPIPWNWNDSFELPCGCRGAEPRPSAKAANAFVSTEPFLHLSCLRILSGFFKIHGLDF